MSDSKAAYTFEEISIELGIAKHDKSEYTDGNEPLLGRRDQRELLTHKLTSEGARYAALVTGNRGSGKTTLVESCIENYQSNIGARFDRIKQGKTLVDYLAAIIALVATCYCAVTYSLTTELYITGTSSLTARMLLFLPFLIPLSYAYMMLKHAVRALFSRRQRYYRSAFSKTVIFFVIIFSTCAMFAAPAPFFTDPFFTVVLLINIPYIFLWVFTREKMWGDNSFESKSISGLKIAAIMISVLLISASVFENEFGKDQVYVFTLWMIFVVFIEKISNFVRDWIKDDSIPKPDEKKRFVLEYDKIECLAFAVVYLSTLKVLYYYCTYSSKVIYSVGDQILAAFLLTSAICIFLTAIRSESKEKNNSARERKVKSDNRRVACFAIFKFFTIAAILAQLSYPLTAPIISKLPDCEDRAGDSLYSACRHRYIRTVQGAVAVKEGVVSVVKREDQKPAGQMNGQVTEHRLYESSTYSLFASALNSYKSGPESKGIEKFLSSVPTRHWDFLYSLCLVALVISFTLVDHRHEKQLGHPERLKPDTESLLELALPRILMNYWTPAIVVQINMGFDSLDHKSVINSMVSGLKEGYHANFISRFSRYKILSFLIFALFILIATQAISRAHFSIFSEDFGNNMQSHINSSISKNGLNFLQTPIVPFPKVFLYDSLQCTESGKLVSLPCKSSGGPVASLDSFNKNNVLPPFLHLHTVESMKTGGYTHTLRVYHLIIFVLLIFIWNRINRSTPLLPFNDIYSDICDLSNSLNSSIQTKSGNTAQLGASTFSFSYESGRSIDTSPIDSRTVELKLIELLKRIHLSNQSNSVIAKFKISLPSPEITFVFDELDKVGTHKPSLSASSLEDFADVTGSSVDTKRLESVYQLLSDMKRAISTAPARFIFVGNQQLHDEWVSNYAGRNNLLTSIFNIQVYVPSFLDDKSFPKSSEPSLSDPIYVYLESYIARSKENYQVHTERLNNGFFFGSNVESINRIAFKNDSSMFKKENENLKLYSEYVTYRSRGNPKKLEVLLQEQTKTKIEDGRYKDVISFSEYDWFRIQFIADQQAFVERSLRRYKNIANDKRKQETINQLDSLMKLHDRAFTENGFRSLGQIDKLHSNNDLEEIHKKLLSHCSEKHLHEISGGIYQYRFVSELKAEISYLRRISSNEKAALSIREISSQSDIPSSIIEGQVQHSPEELGRMGELLEYRKDHQQARKLYKLAIHKIDQDFLSLAGDDISADIDLNEWLNSTSHIKPHQAVAVQHIPLVRSSTPTIASFLSEGSKSKSDLDSGSHFSENTEQYLVSTPWIEARLRLQLMHAMNTELSQNVDEAFYNYANAWRFSRSAIKMLASSKDKHSIKLLTNITFFLQPLFCIAWLIEKDPRKRDSAIGYLREQLEDVSRFSDSGYVEYLKIVHKSDRGEYGYFGVHERDELGKDTEILFDEYVINSSIYNKIGDICFFRGKIGAKPPPERKDHEPVYVDVNRMFNDDPIQYYTGSLKVILPLEQNNYSPKEYAITLPAQLHAAVYDSASDLGDSILSTASILNMEDESLERENRKIDFEQYRDVNSYVDALLSGSSILLSGSPINDIERRVNSRNMTVLEHRILHTFVSEYGKPQFSFYKSSYCRIVVAFAILSASASSAKKSGLSVNYFREHLRIASTALDFSAKLFLASKTAAGPDSLRIELSRLLIIVSRRSLNKAKSYSENRSGLTEYKASKDCELDRLNDLEALCALFEKRSDEFRNAEIFASQKFMCSVDPLIMRYLMIDPKLYRSHTNKLREELIDSLSKKPYPIAHWINISTLILKDKVIELHYYNERGADKLSEEIIGYSKKIGSKLTEFDSPLIQSYMGLADSLSFYVLYCDSKDIDNNDVKSLRSRCVRQLLKIKQSITLGRQHYKNIQDMYYLYDDFNDRGIHHNHAVKMASYSYNENLRSKLKKHGEIMPKP